MASYVMSGNDTVILNGRSLVDFADGTTAKITFPNKIANAKIGKNGNAVFANNATGKLAELELRIMRGSSDDQFLNGLINLQTSSFANDVLLTSTVTKQLGDGAGNVLQDSYILNGGYFAKAVEVEENVEGDTNQNVAVYKLEFATSLISTVRVIG